jgi:hypothetical protein
MLPKISDHVGGGVGRAKRTSDIRETLSSLFVAEKLIVLSFARKFPLPDGRELE